MDYLSFDIEWDGVTHHVDTKQSDIARVEAQFGTSISKIADTTEFGLLLSLAYQRLKKEGIVLGSYDDFLDGEPEIDMDSVKGADEGKAEGSTNETPASTGSSPPSPSKPTSARLSSYG